MNQVGLDISNEVFDAAKQCDEGVVRQQFPNTSSGHRQFMRWAASGVGGARVALEATGVYHIQLALALDGATDIELMVINPCAARRFAQASMVRAKTDGIDANGVLQFMLHMPFKLWSAPRGGVLQLQSLAHRVAQLDKDLSRERSRLHAARRAGHHTELVQKDLQQHIEQLKQRLETTRTQASEVIRHDTQLADDASIIKTAPGFAAISSMKLLAELSALPTDMKAAQWVAYAGLDPRAYESGTSINRPRRISKQGNARIRATLFMSALTAVRHDSNVSAYYEKLITRGKKKMQAITAVMRKLLLALWGMLHHRQEWDGEKFYRLNQPVLA